MFTDVSKCGPQMSNIPTGRHLDKLRVPSEAVNEYGDLLTNGILELRYDSIDKGGEYCTEKGSKVEKVVFGGMMFWQNDGECFLPPTKGDDSPCCEVFMWQPNTEGYYYDNCSMRCAWLVIHWPVWRRMLGVLLGHALR